MKYEYDKLSDEDLFSLLSESKEVSQLAFRELYKRYSSKIHAYLFRTLGEKFFIKDLFQEVFVKVYQIGLKSKGKKLTNFNAYIYQTAKNLCLNHFRVENRMPDIYSEYMTLLSNEKDADYEEELEMVRKAVDKLPPTLKEVFILSEFEGLTYSTIAEMLNESEVNIRVKMHRARKALLGIITRMKKRRKIWQENE